MRFYNKMGCVALFVVCVFSLCACNENKNQQNESESLSTNISQSEPVEIYDFSSGKDIYKVSGLVVDSVDGNYINMKTVGNDYSYVALDETGHTYTCILLPSVDTDIITKEYCSVVENHMDEIEYLDSLIEKGYVVQYFSGKLNEGHIVENKEYETLINENQSETAIIIKVGE